MALEHADHSTSWAFIVGLLAFRPWLSFCMHGLHGPSHHMLVSLWYHSNRVLPNCFLFQTKSHLHLSVPSSGGPLVIHRAFITHMPSLQPHAGFMRDRKAMDPRFMGDFALFPFTEVWVSSQPGRRCGFGGLRFQKRWGNHLSASTPTSNSWSCNSKMRSNVRIAP